MNKDTLFSFGKKGIISTTIGLIVAGTFVACASRPTASTAEDPDPGEATPDPNTVMGSISEDVDAAILEQMNSGSIPSLAELGWDTKIKYIILTTETGISLYTEQFQERKEIDDLLVSGAVWGIQAFLQNVLSEKAQLKVISKGSDVILREEGKYVIGLLIVEQELEILKYLLKQLVTRFEELYADVLENWRGEIDLFPATKLLVSEIFSIEKM